MMPSDSANSPFDVSTSVSSLVAAFTTGLDVFKKLRAKRRRKKSSSKHADEARLGASLSRGPVDIQRHYERSYAAAGEPFARGDAIAHASLTETLLKLNAGLVSIISTFLTRGGSSGNQVNDTAAARLDYRSLADLSDASRADAIAALGQLHARLAQSQLLLNRIRPRCPHCGSTAHASTCKGNDGGSSTDLVPPPSSSKRHGRRSRRSKAVPDAEASIALARVPKSNKDSQTRLVMLRPRGNRKPAAATSSSTELPPLLPEPKSPPPRQAQQQPAKLQPQPSKLSAPQSQSRPDVPAAVAAAPSVLHPRQRVRPFQAQAQPVSYASPPNPNSSTADKPKLKPRPNHSSPHIPIPSTTSTISSHLFPPPPSYHSTAPQFSPQLQPQFQPHRPPPPPFSPPPASLLSFTSDSTKLGEIPMRKWAVPFDAAEAERLNREARECGYAVAAPPRVDAGECVAEVKGGKKGMGWLGRILGRGR